MRKINQFIIERLRLSKNDKEQEYNFKKYDESILDTSANNFQELFDILINYFNSSKNNNKVSSKGISNRSCRLTYYPSHKNIIVTEYFRISFINDKGGIIDSLRCGMPGGIRHGVVMQLSSINNYTGYLDNYKIIGYSEHMRYYFGDNIKDWLYKIKEETEKNTQYGDLDTMIFFGLMK